MSQRGDKLFAEAKKLAEKKTFGKHKHLDEAADRYTEAGNSYKVDHCWERAGMCHMEAANILVKQKNPFDGAREAIEAGKCYSKDDKCVDQAVNSYKFAFDQYKEHDKKAFYAGQCLVDAGNLLMNSDRIDEGVPLVLEATKYFDKGTGNDPQVARCLEQVADVLVEGRKYDEAIKLYEKVITLRLKDSLTQGSSPYTFLKLMLTYLQNGDTIGGRKKVEVFLGQYPPFRNHQFNTFLGKLMTCLENRSINDFDDLYTQFDSTNILDNWTKNRLLDMRHLADEGNIS
ncbi:hypothetical protein M9Y10_001031 [Tritrichomonas musculus]|uniref:Gamma-soluble NSF attachment protein n=1 Tax=Tritrichomonas musculus TaxID=1915356 RepID=A0ABR2L5W1_9EUKA